ncbi:MAG: metal-sensing transcriptional repressor [Candidatus Poribacteria bacterium]|nr:metal-sensing transcriptional repressor [Candidatus Poribacteria bacterium]MDP6962239.1 metal-sensing transcriptional repressor [Dehalococcoidia bacterium]
MHSHTHTKNVINRLSRIEGHVRSIKEMVDSGRDCSEILIQIAAVQSALQRTGKLILEEHLERCITEAVQDGDQKEPLDKFKDALAKFIR